MIFDGSNTFWMTILFQIIINDVASGYSGLYVDNGVSQTVIEENIPRADAQQMQHEIMELLGLPDRLQNERFPSVIRKSVPKFLLKIYKQLSEKDDDTNANQEEDELYLNPRRKRSIEENDLITDENARIIEESDIIMTFLNNRNALPTVEHVNGTRLSFDLSEVSSNGTQLLMSELHLYKRRLPENNLDANLCVITIYGVKIVDGMKRLRPIHTINTTVSFEGWIRVNFTEMLDYWTTKTLSSNLLYITIDYQNDQGSLESSSVDTNYLLSFWDDEHQPFVTAYFKSQDEGIRLSRVSQKHSRGKRSIHNGGRRSTSKPKNPLIDRNRHAGIRNCQRYALYISFKDLQLDNYIIAPEGYGAFYCSGQCTFPMSHNVAQTNHAIIQTLVHLKHPRIPKPCCAPTKLGSTSVIYVLKETNYHLKKYPSMVAKKCGCQ